MKPTHLVTGASGQLGQRVLHHLIETLGIPAERIMAGSRHPASLSAWAECGVTVQHIDFDQPATLEACSGIESALLISADSLFPQGRRLQQHRQAINALRKAQVQHVVYTSAPASEDSPLLIAPDHLGTEATLAESGIPNWTILRNHWYFENLFHALPAAIASGSWYTADAGQGCADISRDDLALAAATVLVRGASGRMAYTLSGTQALSKVKVASAIRALTGKSLEVVQIPLEALVQGMVRSGVPEPIARVLASFDTNTAEGRAAWVTNDFQRITGREPITFENWVQANRSALLAL